MYNMLKTIGEEEKYRIVVGNTGQGSAEERLVTSFYIYLSIYLSYTSSLELYPNSHGMPQ